MSNSKQCHSGGIDLTSFALPAWYFLHIIHELIKVGNNKDLNMEVQRGRDDGGERGPLNGGVAGRLGGGENEGVHPNDNWPCMIWLDLCNLIGRDDMVGAGEGGALAEGEGGVDVVGVPEAGEVGVAHLCSGYWEGLASDDGVLLVKDGDSREHAREACGECGDVPLAVGVGHDVDVVHHEEA